LKRKNGTFKHKSKTEKWSGKQSPFLPKSNPRLAERWLITIVNSDFVRNIYSGKIGPPIICPPTMLDVFFSGELLK